MCPSSVPWGGILDCDSQVCDTIQVRPHTHLALCTRCVCFAKKMMTMCQQISRIRYVSPYGLGLVLLCCGRPLFLTTKSLMGCPLPLSFTLTPLSVGAQGMRLL